MTAGMIRELTHTELFPLGHVITGRSSFNLPDDKRGWFYGDPHFTGKRGVRPLLIGIA